VKIPRRNNVALRRDVRCRYGLYFRKSRKTKEKETEAIHIPLAKKKMGIRRKLLVNHTIQNFLSRDLRSSILIAIIQDAPARNAKNQITKGCLKPKNNRVIQINTQPEDTRSVDFQTGELSKECFFFLRLENENSGGKDFSI
jgi:hypothetical protein